MSMRRKSRALLIKNPMPWSALICSATISVSHAMASDWRSPTKTCGAALGRMIVRNRCHSEKPRTSAVSSNFGSTCLIAEKVLRYSGKLAASATSRTFGSSPMPNHRMNKGINPKCGSARNICRDGSTVASNQRDNPTATPRATPMKPPSSRPSKTRSPDTSRASTSLPLRISWSPASKINCGAGKTS
jgi:hypothetical protein